MLPPLTTAIAAAAVVVVVVVVVVVFVTYLAHTRQLRRVDGPRER